MIPYSRQSIDEGDIRSVVDALRSDFLTTGPLVDQFEREFAKSVNSRQAVAVSSGTAALHAAVACLGIGNGDEVIVPAITFSATANAVVHSGAVPIFVDVDPDTLLVDPMSIRASITPRTRMLVAVDYAGQPCRYDELLEIAKEHDLLLLADSCHAPGASYRGRPVGSIADATVFSFHPSKPITTAEGGMITTDDAELADRMRRFRNHGIDRSHQDRESDQTWEYDIEQLGFNYRLSDLQCALGISQLAKCRAGMERRNLIAARYREAFDSIFGITPVSTRPEIEHSYHLFVVQVDFDRLDLTRARLFLELKEQGVRVNVHYVPVHLLSYYRQRFGTGPGQCPIAEAAYQRIVSLPIFSSMTDLEVEHSIGALTRTIAGGSGCARVGMGPKPETPDQ